MSGAQGSAQATLLKTWIAGVRQTAKRSEHEVAEYPAPPAKLTLEDCAAAGFRMHGPLCARYQSDVMFQVNFSAGLEHQAMLIERRRRWGRKGWSGTLLWIDREPVPVPVDLDGNPSSAELAHWLNHRFATDFPAAEDSPNRAVLLWTWESEVGRIAHGPHSYIKDYPAPPRLLTREDCRAIGFEFNNDGHTAWNFLDETAKSTVRVEFSPDLRHAAVSIKREDWSGALLWVDGEPVPVPRRQNGDPLCEKFTTWLDSRFVYAQIGSLDHPLFDPSKFDPLGDIRGVLVWDALRHTRYIEHPEPAQAWTSPLACARDGSLRIYADGQAFRQGRHDRLLPIPD